MSANLPPEFIAAGIWIWESFSKDLIKNLASSAKTKIDKEWEKFEWSLASKRYRERMYDLYSTMRILGNPSPVLLEGIFTDVQILDKPTAFRRYDIEKLKESYSTRGYIDEINKRIDALDVIRKEDNLFILGKPGAGKTTLLKHITLLATKGELGKVPIFVSLNDWSQSNQRLMSQHDLVDYIVQQFEICSFPDAQLFIENSLLKNGRAIILFDGLDEVNEENQMRNQVTRILTDFTNQYPKNKFVITCRVAATDYTFEQFRYVEIADFTEEQISIFVQKWFSIFPDKGKRFLREINQFQNRGLYELARTPILLSLLCMNFDETLSFPIRRNEIYQEAIDALLKKWDSSRNIKRDEIYHGLSPLRKRQLLSRIAAEYFQKGEIFFSTNDVVKRIQSFLQTLPEMRGDNIDGEIVLKAIEAQHGILVERARGIHSFSHLSLQEFFTSQYIVENSSEIMILQLMEHLANFGWHEVFLMVTGALPNADDFFRAFSDKRKSLINEQKSIRKINRIVSRTPHLTPLQRLTRLLVTSKYHLSNVFLKMRLEHTLDEINYLISFLREDFDIRNFVEIKETIRDKCRGLNIQLSEIDASGAKYEKISLSSRVLLGDLRDILDKEETIKDAIKKAATIYDLIRQVQGEMESLSKRRIASAEIDLEIELHDIEDIFSNIKNKIESSLFVIDELSKELSVDITKDDWYMALSSVQPEEFQIYLYIQKLFLECVSVSAVSNRDTIISENFLQ